MKQLEINEGNCLIEIYFKEDKSKLELLESAVKVLQRETVRERANINRNPSR